MIDHVMTSLHPPSDRTSSRPAVTAGVPGVAGLPPVVLAVLCGVAAAASTLVVCLGAGVIGWFLTDEGSHGAPRDGLRTGALAWLMAHGSGVHVQGVAITALPLGLTLMCAWACWRTGHRVGLALAGHGPTAAEIGDGQRDWTVPSALGLFTVGYVVTAVLVCSVASTAGTAPAARPVVLWSVLLCLLAAAPGIAVGSGRAAVWLALAPSSALGMLRVCRQVVLGWCLLGAVAFAVALVVDFSTAVNVMSQLHANAGAVVLMIVVSALVLPNAVIYAGCYLLGPGFAVGTATVVSPSTVVLGPLPAFPMLAALPDDGATPSWTGWFAVLPPLLAFGAAVWVQRGLPTIRYDEGALRGGGGGVAAGVLFGLLASIAGGAVGPGRMADVGPFASDVLLHAVAAFGLGGALGGLAMTWWQRRDLRLAADSVQG